MTHSLLYTQPDQRSLSAMTHDAAKYLDLFHGHCTFEGPYTLTSDLFNFLVNTQLTDVRKCQILHHLAENGIDMIKLINSSSGFAIKSFILGLDLESLEGYVASPLKYIQNINDSFYFALEHDSVILINHLLSLFKLRTEKDYKTLENYIGEAVLREKPKIAEILLKEYIARPDNIHVKFYMDIYCKTIKYRMFNIKSMIESVLEQILTRKDASLSDIEQIKNLMELGSESIPFTHPQVKMIPHLYHFKEWAELQKHADNLDYLKEWISKLLVLNYNIKYDLLTVLLRHGSDEVLFWYLQNHFKDIDTYHINDILKRNDTDFTATLQYLIEMQPFDVIIEAYRLKLRNLVKHILTTVNPDTAYGNKELFITRMVYYNDIEMLRLIPMNKDEMEWALKHSLIRGDYDIYMRLRRRLPSDHVFSEYMPIWAKAAKNKGFFELASLPPAPFLHLRARM